METGLRVQSETRFNDEEVTGLDRIFLVRRMMRRFLFVIVGVPMCACMVIASEESVRIFKTFRFEASDESGPVVISGTQNDSGISSLQIAAFRRSFTLAPAQLKQLRGLMVNGMQLSGEPGYESLGGRTLYLLLSMGFSSGTTKAKLISVNQRGDIKVEAWKSR